MRNFCLNKYNLKSLAASAIFLHSFIALAGDPTFNDISDLTFGTLETSPSGGSITVPSDGSSPSGTFASIDNAAARGQYFLVGDNDTPTNTMTIDIQNINTNSAALTLDSFTGVYGATTISSFPVMNLTTPTTSGTAFYLGARLSYTSAITEGNYTLNFNVVITIY